jgi:hypothetical protein
MAKGPGGRGFDGKNITSFPLNPNPDKPEQILFMYGHRKHPSSAVAALRRVDRITLKLKITFGENLCSSVV